MATQPNKMHSFHILHVTLYKKKCVKDKKCAQPSFLNSYTTIMLSKRALQRTQDIKH